MFREMIRQDPATNLLQLIVAMVLIGYWFDTRIKPQVQNTPWHLPLRTTAWAVYLACMPLFYRVSAQDFVYFQF